MVTMSEVAQDELDQPSELQAPRSYSYEPETPANTDSDGISQSAPVPQPNVETYSLVPILGRIVEQEQKLSTLTDDLIQEAYNKACEENSQPPLTKGVKYDFLIEEIADFTGPPRFIPLVGMAAANHRHYKCTILSESETTRIVYIDYQQMVLQSETRY